MNKKITLMIILIMIILLHQPNITHALQNNKQSRYILIWMGLEVVNEDIKTSLEQLKTHANIISAISYESYILQSDGTFTCRPGVTDITEDLKALGVELWPMITSTNINNMRKLFSNPDPFITEAVNLATSLNITGYNIDFEPTSATTDDAYNYANFLNKLANALHSVNKKLSVDIATWSLIWNYDLLAESKIDIIYDMSTYAGRFETFYTNLNNAISKIPLSKLGIGLETLNPNTGETSPFTEEEIEARLRSIIKSNVNRIAIWRTPLPDYWWPLLEDFKNGFNITININNPQPLVGTNITIKIKTIKGIEPFTYIWKLNNTTLNCITQTCSIKINNTNTQTLTILVIDGLYINVSKTIIISPVTNTTTQPTTNIQQNITQNIIITLIIFILIIIIITSYKYHKK